MLLSDLEWVPGYDPIAIRRWCYIGSGRHLAIFEMGDGTYVITKGMEEIKDLDALTAQAVLFEITREGNDAV